MMKVISETCRAH